MPFINVNGRWVADHEPVLPASNKSYRYGDGFFETIKVWSGKILLAPYHQKRIEESLALLQYKVPGNFTVAGLFERITMLCQKNDCLDAARVRLSFSNGCGGLFDAAATLHYIIEAWPLYPIHNEINEEGLTTGLFTQAKKYCDRYANLKSASALLYSQAAAFASQNSLNEAIILNHKGNICESIIANIFWIKDGTIYTPPLSEGCVSGVMRAFLTDTIPGIVQKEGTLADLQNADELFLTNAIRGIRWVKRFDDKTYTNTRAQVLFNKYLKPTF